MSQLKDKQWWIAAGTRAIRTIAQTAMATIGTAALMDQVNWIAVGSASLLAGVLSLLTALSGLPELGNEAEINETSNSDEEE